MTASSPESPSRPGGRRVMRVRVTGFPRRVLAALVDLVLLSAVTTAVSATVAMVLRVPIPEPRELGPDLLVAGILDRSPMALGALGLFLGMAGLYQLYFAGIAGQTLGMRLVGIRLICGRGRPPGPGRGLLRIIAFVPSVAPAALGWLWALFDREHRALHDHLAGTYVILDEG
jgi:uncharacterized RDD family membrane protein YckC